MTTSIRQAKAKLSELIATAERGEEVIIASNGKPRVRLTPIPKKPRATFDWEKMRRLAKQGSTGRKGPDATQIISDLREERWST